MSVMIFHENLARLWVLNKKRPLTPKEMKEVQECLAANANYVWEMAYLENMSLMASMTNDVDWQHEICREIDECKIKKSAPQRKTDRKKPEQ
jgi:dephospho-CoA kinase